MATKQRNSSKPSAQKSRPGKGGTPPKPTPRPSPTPHDGGGGGGHNAEVEPPIIVQGGSLTIRSPVFLSVVYDAGSQTFIYSNPGVKITKYKAKVNGKPDKGDDTDNGQFEIELDRNL